MVFLAASDLSMERKETDNTHLRTIVGRLEGNKLIGMRRQDLESTLTEAPGNSAEFEIQGKHLVSVVNTHPFFCITSHYKRVSENSWCPV